MNQPPSRLAPELESILRDLDTLADAERNGANANLESRMHQAVMRTVQPAPAPHLRFVPAAAPQPGGPIPTSARWISPLRMAAAVALVATLGVCYLAVRSPGGRAGVGPVPVAGAESASDFDEWLLLETRDNALATELDLLLADTHRLSQGIYETQTADGEPL